MHPESAIVITGAAGFIGSYLVGYLNRKGYNNLILVDDFSRSDKSRNLAGKAFSQQIHRDEFENWWHAHPDAVQYCFHLGARTDTTEMDYEVHRRLNLEYSKMIWRHCAQTNTPLVYASSAATYGGGEEGYADDQSRLDKLTPLNPYGLSKHKFDQWALQQTDAPPFWAGLKFFNVYGPNEYHKGRMASVIFHAFHQIQKEGQVKLFRSHNPAYSDGGQMRDFVFVDDIAAMCFWLMDNQPVSGIYNAGSGTARTFQDLVRAIFKSLELPENITFIDTPADIRDKYQYFTEADMRKLRAAGFSQPLTSLEDGVASYVRDYLVTGSYY